MTIERGLGPVRSLVLRAGTVAGVVAVLALPASAEAAPRSGSGSPSASTSATSTAAMAAPTITAPAPRRGRIVDAAALAAAPVVTSQPNADRTMPAVNRAPLRASAVAADLVASAPVPVEVAP